MAIKFEDKGETKPAKKEVGGKTYVTEEPSAKPETDVEAALPFAKPVRPDKKPRKARP